MNSTHRVLNIHGIRIWCHLWGHDSQPPLILLHGNMDSGASFQKVASLLSQHYYCIAPDLRGFGKSSHSTDPLAYHFYDYVADLHQIIAHFSDKSVALLGHSLGAYVGTLYSGSYPEKVSHFINVEGFGVADLGHEAAPARLRRWVKESRGEQKPRRFRSIEEYQQVLQKRYPTMSAETLAWWAPTLVQEDPTDGGFYLRADIRHRRVNPYLFFRETMRHFCAAIRAKVLLVYGDRNEVNVHHGDESELLAERNQRLRYYPAHSEHCEFMGQGHMIHLDDPRGLAEAALKFLGHHLEAR